MLIGLAAAHEQTHGQEDNAGGQEAPAPSRRSTPSASPFHQKPSPPKRQIKANKLRNPPTEQIYGADRTSAALNGEQQVRFAVEILRRKAVFLQRKRKSPALSTSLQNEQIHGDCVITASSLYCIAAFTILS